MKWWQYLLGIPGEAKSGALPGNLEFFREVYGYRTSKAGQAVNVRTALETSIVIACARVIAEGLAQVPCKVQTGSPEGSRVDAFSHPLYDLLGTAPNDWQTSFEFREQLGFHLALAGNAFVFINRLGSGKIAELMPFEPGWVTVRRNTDFSLGYRVQLPQSEAFDVPAENMWHIRGPSWAGYVGLDMVYQARNAIGLALATEEYGSGLFRNGARPGGLITVKQALKQDDVELLRKAWNEVMGGSGNAMNTAVMSGDMDYKALAQTAEEAQFIETRKLIVHEVCRFMRVLPIMVMQSDDTTSYASVEQMLLAHLTHTLMPWYERIEQSARLHLLTPAERASGLEIKLDARGMLRGTAKERAEYLEIMRRNGVITANQWLQAEDMPRSSDPEADKLLLASNIYGPPPAAKPGV